MNETYDLDVSCTCESEAQRLAVEKDIIHYAMSKLGVKSQDVHAIGVDEVLEISWTGSIVMGRDRLSFDDIKNRLEKIALDHGLCFEIDCTCGDMVLGTVFVGVDANSFELEYLLNEMKNLIPRLLNHIPLLVERLGTDERNVRKALTILSKTKPKDQ